jgi:cell division septation protein DedD
MSKKTNPETEQLNEFDLRYRVTGAAVLLFLGALVLPWLLGPPSAASKIDAMPLVAAVSEVEVANIITSARGSETEIMNDEIAETVYISKITPLDAKRNSDLVRAANQAAASTKARPSKQQSAAAEKSIAEKSIAAKADEIKLKKIENEGVLRKANIVSDAQQQAKRERDLQAALAAELKSQTEKAEAAEKESLKTTAVDLGWVVQVGLFTEKKRAIALVSELKKKGFSASSSVVDTNRGKKTGTRVWLGPFAKRIAAINQQKRLKSKAGKEGFIRVYP